MDRDKGIYGSIEISGISKKPGHFLMGPKGPYGPMKLEAEIGLLPRVN